MVFRNTGTESLSSVIGAKALSLPDSTHVDPAKLGILAQLGFAQPWTTVQDAIGDLPAPAMAGEVPVIPNHVSRSYSAEVVQSFADTMPGQRNPKYKRDRLRWNEPAKTIRAQGKPKADGSGQKNSSHQSLHPEEHRQLTVRESARIQTFPDWYVFDSSFVNGYRIVGDAVPPVLGAILAAAIRDQMVEPAPPKTDEDTVLAGRSGPPNPRLLPLDDLSYRTGGAGRCNPSYAFLPQPVRRRVHVQVAGQPPSNFTLR